MAPRDTLARSAILAVVVLAIAGSVVFFQGGSKNIAHDNRLEQLFDEEDYKGVVDYFKEHKGQFKDEGQAGLLSGRAAERMKVQKQGAAKPRIEIAPPVEATAQVDDALVDDDQEEELDDGSCFLAKSVQTVGDDENDPLAFEGPFLQPLHLQKRALANQHHGHPYPYSTQIPCQ